MIPLSNVTLEIIEADWPAPPGLTAFTTTRIGGRSNGAYGQLNLGHHVGDDPGHVASNRALVQSLLPSDSQISWLDQVHGTTVVEAGQPEVYPQADACWTDRPGRACAVLTADCLPVLFCDSRGGTIAAAHAGWRGLLAGVLESTVQAMPAVPVDILAWLGPAIGPARFEVGAEVREAFLSQTASPELVDAVAACFVPVANSPTKFLADLYGLARIRLRGAGLTGIFGGNHCTHSDPDRFYSYRRDGQSGRMASVICLPALQSPHLK